MLASTKVMRQLVRNAMVAVDMQAFIHMSKTDKASRLHDSPRRNMAFQFVFAEPADVAKKLRLRLKELGYTNNVKVTVCDNNEYLRVNAVLRKK